MDQQAAPITQNMLNDLTGGGSHLDAGYDRNLAVLHSRRTRGGWMERMWAGETAELIPRFVNGPCALVRKY
jgi:hypothetical protein